MDNAPIRRVHTWETEIKAFPFRHPKSSASKPQREYVHVDYTSTVPQLIGRHDGTFPNSEFRLCAIKLLVWTEFGEVSGNPISRNLIFGICFLFFLTEWNKRNVSTYQFISESRTLMKCGKMLVSVWWMSCHNIHIISCVLCSCFVYVFLH